MSTEPTAHPHLYDHYEIERVLGRGAMGVVYLARDLRIGRRVALKTLQEKHQNFDSAEAAKDFLERFRREAELCGSLIHPNIITLYDVGYDRSRITYLAMEYVDGESLLSLLRRHGKLDLETALKITDDVLQALAYAHDRGVIHRDIKPANILVTVEGQAKVADFGVARSVRASLALKTQEGQILGTPYYMAPEHVSGKGVEARSDLFSLGVVLFEMLSGHKPFDGRDVMETLYNVVNQPTPNLCAIAPDIPRWAANFVERLLQKEPADRFLSASAASRELRRLLATHRSIVEQEIDMTVSVPVLRATAPEETPTTPLSTPPSARLERSVPRLTAVGVIAAALAALLATIVVMTRQVTRQSTATISHQQAGEFEKKRIMLREAQILYNAGAYEASLNHFDQYLQKYPGTPAAVHGREQARQAIEAIRARSVPAVTKIEVIEEGPTPRRQRRREPVIDPAADQVATASIVEEAFDREPAEPPTLWDRVRLFFRRTFRRAPAADPEA